MFAVSILFGLGLGFTMQPLVLAVQNAVEVRDMGVATSSSLFFRQMGGTLGTAVFLSVLFSTVGPNIAAAFRTASQTPEFQAAVADPAVVADPANAPVLGMLQGGGGACRRWTTRRSSTPSTRGSRSRSSTASRSRWTPCCCWPRSSWCSA